MIFPGEGVRGRDPHFPFLTGYNNLLHLVHQGCGKVIYEAIKQRESITEELLQAGHNTDDAHQELWDPLGSAE